MSWSMSLFYCVINWSLDTSGILLRRLDAGGEELDEFGAIGEEGVKSGRGVDKFAVAQELKPVLGLCRFLERDLEL